jgi:VCBS repeat-containing protein
VTVTVRPVNDAPVAEDASATTDEDTAVTIVLSASDIDSSALTFTSVDDPSHGSVSFAGNTATYTPAPNYYGADSFRYRVADGDGGFDTAIVEIVVRPVNDAPVAENDAASTPEDTPIAIDARANDSDLEGDALNVVSVTAPAHGTASIAADGTVLYTPGANFHGTDFVDYVVADTGGLTDGATITVTVTPVNDAPVAEDGSATTDEDIAVDIPLVASDVDGDVLGFSSVDGPDHGTLTIASNVAKYTPAPNYSGTDSFTFRASDGSLSDTGHITITVRPVNDPPTAQADGYSLDEDTTLTVVAPGVLGNDADDDSDALTAVLARGPAHGTLVLNADGSLAYTPNANYNGPDSFTYRASDGRLSSDAVTVSLTVRPVNDAPTVRGGDDATVDEGGATVALTAIGADPDGDALTYTWAASGGTVAGSGAGATFSADDGPASHVVTVTVSDGTLSSSDTIAVAVRNVAPTASAGGDKTGVWGFPIAFAGTASDPSSADTAAGLAPTWTFGDGSAAINAANTTHTYAAGGTYTATFASRDKDGGTASDTATVTVEKRRSAIEWTGSTSALFGGAVLSAKFVDTVDTPTAVLAGHTLLFQLNGDSWTAVTNAQGVATVTPNPLVSGGTVTVSFAGDSRYLASSKTQRLAITSDFGDAEGFFLVGDLNAGIGQNVTFWGAHWWQVNRFSGGTAPAQEKGWVSQSLAPSCGITWTSRPGNSGHPPATVPKYLAVVVTSRVTNASPSLVGDTRKIVIVETNPGYSGNPGHPGTGTVIARVCG